MSSSSGERKLCDIFDDAYELYLSFDKCTDQPTNHPEYQAKIKRCIQLFEEATKLVSLTSIFSTNEFYEEIATTDLKYFLLPFFLGQLCLKLCNGERQEIIEVADVYYRDFIKRCTDYGLIEQKENKEIQNSSDEPSIQLDDNNMKMENLRMMARQRQSKLDQYKQKKELDEQIKQLKIVIERESYDENTQREFYIKLLKSSIFDALQELDSIQQEKQMLEYAVNMRTINPDFGNKPKKRLASHIPLKPIIITKDEIQKSIYGMGYPSLPTMTVAEFYEDRVREGIFPDPSAAPNYNSLHAKVMRGDTADIDEEEEIKKENQIENDDEEYLARARNIDEYKDTVRRGDGNRYNRS